MVKIIISGIAGRMGKRIGLLASKDRDIEIIGALEASDNPAIGKDVGEVLEIGKIGRNVESGFNKIPDPADALIEFATPEATVSHLEPAVRKKVGMVIGTTAFSSRQIEEIKKAALEIPVVFSPNMSVGANLLFRITEETTRMLGMDYEVKIVEAHHAGKKDAPSGTARRLGEVVSRVRGDMPAIQSIREGDIVGDHTVIFAGRYDTVELRHSAHSRDVFAKGALAAVKFVAGKKPGLYSMQDVINS